MQLLAHRRFVLQRLDAIGAQETRVILDAALAAPPITCPTLSIDVAGQVGGRCGSPCAEAPIQTAATVSIVSLFFGLFGNMHRPSSIPPAGLRADPKNRARV